MSVRDAEVLGEDIPEGMGEGGAGGVEHHARAEGGVIQGVALSGPGQLPRMGGEGGEALAQKVLDTLEHKESHYHALYPDEMSLKDKVKTIATEIYGADGVSYAPASSKALARIEEMGFGNLPVCMAKTQYSLSDDQTKLGRPTGFTINVRDAYVSAGAGFVVVLTGAIMTMPGLPKKPAADGIDVDENGVITGLF